MMEQSVPNARLVNVARFRVSYLERLICGMSIGFGNKITMKRNNIRHEISLELLHILAGPLSSREFFPRLEQIFERYDMIVIIMQQDFGHNLKNTPPRTDFASFRQS